MQLGFGLTSLLASLIVAISAPELVDAAPLRPPQATTKRAPNGMITMPLKRVPQRTDVHPQLLLQQHINRSHRRLARMTGREEPSRRDLETAIAKRAYHIEKRGETLHRRFTRPSTNSDAITANAHGNKTAAGSAQGATANAGKAGKNKGGAAAAAGGNATATATASAAAGSGTGIPEIDVEAAANGGLTDANTPTTSNSLGLNIEANDVGYIATVQMGTPATNYLLLMDSGSADLWVGSADSCTSTAGGGCGNHTFLGTSTSSTFTNTNKQWQITYGSGAVAGDIVTDNVAIDGLALNAHTFGVATSETDDFSADTVPFDGLMGLAQSTLSEQGVLTPPESLAKAGTIASATTSFKISRLADQLNDGEVTFGGLDTSKFDNSTLTTLDNVSQEGFWEASMDAVTADGTDLGLTGRSAILDTGTTLMVIPQADADTVHAAIPGAQSDGQGGYTIPCTTSTSIAMTFGGTSFAIDPRDLLFAPVDPNDLTGDCVSGISAGTVGTDTEWLVGDVFLKNAYFSVNVENNQVQLAKLV